MKAEFYKKPENTKGSIIDKISKTTFQHDEPEGQFFVKKKETPPLSVEKEKTAEEEEAVKTAAYRMYFDKFFRKKVRKGKQSWMEEFSDELESFERMATHLNEPLTKDERKQLNKISKSIEALKQIKKKS